MSFISENLNDLKFGSEAWIENDLEMNGDFGLGGSGRGSLSTGLLLFDLFGSGDLINLNGNSIVDFDGDVDGAGNGIALFLWIWFDLFDEVWIYLNGNSIDFRSENDDVVDVVVAVDVDDLVGGAGNDNILGLVFKLLLLLLLKVCLSSFITISLHIGHS